jgi:alkylation response protein AidB-like acyl-CoA dehydrogenase
MTMEQPHDMLRELRDSARGFLARAIDAPPDETDPASRPAFWPEIAALGWTALLGPEELGGFDAGLDAACVIVEELAYSGAASPFMSSAVLATRALAAAPQSPLAARWLPDMAEGKATATVALTGSNGLADEAGLGVSASAGTEGGVVLDGAARFVADAQGANLLLVAAREANGGLVLAGIERTHPALRLEALVTHDRGHQLSHVFLENADCPATSVLARGEEARGTFEAVKREGIFALAADSLGAAHRAFDLALAYAMQRHQFGRPIGSFQAIKHKLANMSMYVTGSSALLYQAAAAIDSGLDPQRAIAAVGCYVREAASMVAGESMQIHGAAGYVWEHPCHRLLKRTKFNERYLSTLWAERDRLAGIALAGAGPER